ncbi:OLC1v1003307C1 [Oldenlandia corymbosa var. corymbosa]|uniref:Glycosyltransferase n=1 Tax=Oldenlandia corymbosa var. corymbosa TaxID=529605 RepID=A0AAV1DBM5_OLDCO|nr:OLC1v1003307C1 [Oldenlandia corymbosa var. corymbosa]
MSEHQPYIFFFPLMAQGHMLPTINMAKLFSSRGIKATLITTHRHAAMFNKTIEKSLRSGFPISVRAIRFPAAEVGLPEGFESLDDVTTEDTLNKFSAGVAMLREPTEELIRECRPDCLVSDLFLPWTTDSAAKFGIPRLCFHGSSSFNSSVAENIKRYKPYKEVASESDPFFLPDFPHQIKLTRAQIPESLIKEDQDQHQTDFGKMIQKISDSVAGCYGVIVNSFYELESDYVNYNKETFGIRAWNIGPLFLQIDGEESEPSIDKHDCLKWLDSRETNSVVFVCFGSLSHFTAAQLHEIAKGLESSGQDFIWVVRKCIDEENREKWFPENFEERIKGKGLIVTGWAPQVLILQHEAVGAFVTHCGWNSVLEGVCSGLPMVTCPLFADQFFNEKLLTDVLKIGVSAGAHKNSWISSDAVKDEALAKAIEKVMVDEEAVEMRNRAKELSGLAKKAVENGGSSYLAFWALVEELRAYGTTRKQE